MKILDLHLFVLYFLKCGLLQPHCYGTIFCGELVAGHHPGVEASGRTLFLWGCGRYYVIAEESRPRSSLSFRFSYALNIISGFSPFIVPI